MSRHDIHSKAFDEGTLLKLDLFERYTRAWFPTFASRSPEHTYWPRINIVDFFAGEGSDSAGNLGSALRLMGVLGEYRGLIARLHIRAALHLSDGNPQKVEALREAISKADVPERLDVGIEAAAFRDRLNQLHRDLNRKDSANLLIIVQYGVREVDEEVFRQLTSIPTTDFLFFVASSTFHRFKDLPEIRQYLEYERPEDYYRAHQAVFARYTEWLPANRKFHLGHFSIKKGSNIYGVVFGSGHPLGMKKFLDEAWKLDKVNGSANFDIEREGIYGANPDAPLLPGLDKPKKLSVFEDELQEGFKSRTFQTELDIVGLCFKHGVTTGHARELISAAKSEGIIQCRFRVPSCDGDHVQNPRQIEYP